MWENEKQNRSGFQVTHFVIDSFLEMALSERGSVDIYRHEMKWVEAIHLQSSNSYRMIGKYIVSVVVYDPIQ